MTQLCSVFNAFSQLLPLLSLAPHLPYLLSASHYFYRVWRRVGVTWRGSGTSWVCVGAAGTRSVLEGNLGKASAVSPPVPAPPLSTKTTKKQGCHDDVTPLSHTHGCARTHTVPVFIFIRQCLNQHFYEAIIKPHACSAWNTCLHPRAGTMWIILCSTI